MYVLSSAVHNQNTPAQSFLCQNFAKKKVSNQVQISKEYIHYFDY